MKKIFLLLSTSFVFSATTIAERVSGVIIFENETINATFEIPSRVIPEGIDYLSLQKKVIYFDSKNVQQEVLPIDAKEVQLFLPNDTIRLVSVEVNGDLVSEFKDRKHMFLKLIVDGEAQLFRYFSIEYRPYVGVNFIQGGPDKGSEYVLRRANENFLWPKRSRFKKQMSSFLASRPDIVTKINMGQYQMKDLPKIIEDFNNTSKIISI